MPRGWIDSNQRTGIFVKGNGRGKVPWKPDRKKNDGLVPVEASSNHCNLANITSNMFDYT